jgi:hypothetical protein
MHFRKTFKLQQPFSQQIPRPLEIRTGMVMKCSRNLNQALKKLFVRIECFEPHFLPKFVGLVKMGGVERLKPFLVQPIPLV